MDTRLFCLNTFVLYWHSSVVLNLCFMDTLFCCVLRLFFYGQSTVVSYTRILWTLVCCVLHRCFGDTCLLCSILVLYRHSFVVCLCLSQVMTQWISSHHRTYRDSVTLGLASPPTPLTSLSPIPPLCRLPSLHTTPHTHPHPHDPNSWETDLNCTLLSNVNIFS